MKTSPVFSRVIKEYNNKAELIILQGGTASSKTYSVLQLLYMIAKLGKQPKVISVVSYALPHLKLGAIRDFKNILTEAGEDIGRIYNITEQTFYIGKSLIEFFSTDNLGKVHGPRRDILFINEANNIKFDIYDQLAIRTRQCVILDFNPVQSFWVHEELIPKYKHSFIKSTYRDNPFLDLVTIKRIEHKREINANWWRIYGEGEIGILEGAIFTNWRFGEFDTSLPFGFGLDFGYQDEDAMGKVAVDNRKMKLYFDECIYSAGNSFEALKGKVSQFVTGNQLIIGDCADARMIGQMRDYFNIRPVNKGKWTVHDGIKMLQSYEIIITERSYNMARELKNYCWNDKKAGIPMDGFDHLISAMRYFWMEFTDRSRIGLHRIN